MIRVLIVMAFFQNIVAAQTGHLQNLVAERRTLYTQWKEALDQKSGIFGNQTKADLEEINEVLKQIIRKDNDILEALDESQTAEYQQLQQKYNSVLEENLALQNRQKAIENKLKEEKTYQKQNYSQIERAEGDRILWALVSLISFLILIVLYIKLKKTRQKLISLENLIKKS